jgi:hypothetical protein
MTQTTSGRHGLQPRTRFDDTRRKTLVGLLIALVALIVLATALVVIGSRSPDLGLTLQLGGFSRSKDVQPRNFRLWAIQPDGKLRFVTVFYPARGNAPASEVFTVAGPLVNNPQDTEQTRYFGALNINSQIQNGQGNDSTRFYRLFWVEHDPSVAAYGVDIVTQNPPYVSLDSKDIKMRNIAMGAPQQTYYAQVIVAIAFPPGAIISDVAYALPDVPAGAAPETLLKPYRRLTISGWTVYFYDQTLLVLAGTVRIRYSPPANPKPAPELSIWDTDARR